MSTYNPPKVSRGLRVLSSQPRDPTPTQEVAALQKEAQSVEEWFASSRFAHTLRPYSAMDVVSLRPSPQARCGSVSPNCEYSNASSEKLYSLLRNLHASGGYSHTFGALDPVQVIQMAPHLTSIYVSGWQCSSTASTTNEPGPDFADYPMNTVPNKVDHLVRAQRHHDRRQQQERADAFIKEGEAGLRKLGPPIDYMRPVIADGDTGHGGLSAVMKLMKLFVEAGAAGVHFEDQKVCCLIIDYENYASVLLTILLRLVVISLVQRSVVIWEERFLYLLKVRWTRYFYLLSAIGLTYLQTPAFKRAH